MKKIYIHMLVLVFLLAAAPFVVSARNGADDTLRTTTTSSRSDSSSSETETETETEHLATTSSEVERSTELKNRKQELEDRLAEKKAKIAEKLAGKRAEACEKKSSEINNVIDNRSNALQRHLTRFNSIRDRIAAFIVKKQLTSEQLTTLEAAMNTAQANAQAAVDTLKGTGFVCKEADASNPGGLVKDAWTSAKEALKAYRSAIKAYAKEARTLAEASEAATGTGDDSTADQGSGDTSTGGAQ